jgi:predicted branched-subunit amino acid permease
LKKQVQTPFLLYIESDFILLLKHLDDFFATMVRINFAPMGDERGKGVLLARAFFTKNFWDGAQAAVPPGLGCIPDGLSIGLLAMQAGMSKLEGILLSVLVMAGASELMTIGMMTAGAPVAAIILGTFFLNLRHFVMSASVWRRIEGASLGDKLLGSFALCDESFAVFSLS